MRTRNRARIRAFAKYAAMLAVAFAVWAAGSFGPIAPFVQSVKRGATDLTLAQANEELRQWIEAEASRRSEPPANAVVDRVWKVIPGYDGRTVDVEATYAKAKALGLPPGDAAGFPWVYRYTPPAIGLDKLPMGPIYRGHPAKPAVALMINVAWGDEHIGPMLETLDEEQVKATFFFDGTWLKGHEQTARDIMAKGHELSNHAYTHPDMGAMSVERQRSEIGRTEELLKKLGVRNVWFAPPSGSFNEGTIRAAAEFGLRTVLWTLDTVDWKKPPAAAVVDKIAAQVGPGSLILMHPTETSKGALRGIIRAIRAKGYVPGTVSETLSERRIDDGA